MSTFSKLATAIIAMAAFAFGVVVQATSEPANSDWLSFAGAVLGSGITVLGGITILQWQRDREINEQAALLLLLLTDVENSLTPYQMANPTALKARLNRTTAEQVRITREAIRRVQKFRTTFKPQTVGHLKADDVLADLDFDDPSFEGWMTGYVMYPDSADFGALNFLAHDQQAKIDRARQYLTRR